MEIKNRFTKKLKHYDLPCHAHELTFSCYRGRNFFGKERVCQWLAESIDKARAKLNFALWAYVFMLNHAHILIYPLQENYSIAQIERLIKQPVAQKAINWLKKNNPIGLKQLETGLQSRKHRFWQKGTGYDRNIIKMDTLINSVKYIHNNPVKKNLVELPQQWYYSSAVAWMDLTDEPLKIDKDSWPR
ncbi:MAG: transposase [Phycisphaerae bacterium]|nr:transposase [Phycisphaerae bacterium]